MVPDPERTARAILRKFGHPGRDAVAVFDLARRAGVTIHEKRMSESHARAAIAIDRHGRPHIFIRELDALPWARARPIQRFWLAHELGHLALYYRRVRLAYERRERWCSEFAAALLLPEEVVHIHRRWGRDAHLAWTYGVSDTVVQMRLRQLKRRQRRLGATG